jgi:hypothetical protein
VFWLLWRPLLLVRRLRRRPITLDFEPGSYQLVSEIDNFRQYTSHGIFFELFGAIDSGVLNVEGGTRFASATYTAESVDLRGPATVQVRAQGNIIDTLNLGSAFATFGPYNALTGIVFTTDPSQNFALDNLVFNTGVPEPATWAMMIVGFGAIGAACRRRALERRAIV